jgi:hypothetical protein
MQKWCKMVGTLLKGSNHGFNNGSRHRLRDANLVCRITLRTFFTGTSERKTGTYKVAIRKPSDSKTTEK